MASIMLAFFLANSGSLSGSYKTLKSNEFYGSLSKSDASAPVADDEGAKLNFETETMKKSFLSLTLSRLLR